MWFSFNSFILQVSQFIRHLLVQHKLFFVLMLNVPVNSYGHVGVLPQFNGTFIQNKDVMISKYKRIQI